MMKQILFAMAFGLLLPTFSYAQSQTYDDDLGALLCTPWVLLHNGTNDVYLKSGRDISINLKKSDIGTLAVGKIFKQDDFNGNIEFKGDIAVKLNFFNLDTSSIPASVRLFGTEFLNFTIEYEGPDRTYETQTAASVYSPIVEEVTIANDDLDKVGANCVFSAAHAAN